MILSLTYKSVTVTQGRRRTVVVPLAPLLKVARQLLPYHFSGKQFRQQPNVPKYLGSTMVQRNHVRFTLVLE